jgi:hypothetical protein
VCVVVIGGGWLLYVCGLARHGGKSEKSETKVQTVTPNPLFEFGLSVWTFGLDLRFGLSVWTFGFVGPIRMRHATEP